MRVSRAWEDRGYLKSFRRAGRALVGKHGPGGQGEPWRFGGAGTACEGEQEAGRTGCVPGALEEKVQLVRVSRAWEDRRSP